MTCSAGWIELKSISIRDDNSKEPIVIFINSSTGTGPIAGQWHRVSLASVGIPPDADGVFLTGLLIITHGSTPQICDLTISFRAPGNALNEGNYIGQAVETHVTSGERSNMSTWAQARDGEIEFYWNRSTQGTYPSECAYGINLSAQMIGFK